MDLFAARHKLMCSEQWQPFLNNFLIPPFLQKPEDYEGVFNKFFDKTGFTQQTGLSKTEKIYTEDQLVEFLSNWMPEVRHLRAQGIDPEDYVLQLVRSLSSQSDNISKEVHDGETIYKFTEILFTYYADSNLAKKQEKTAKVSSPFWNSIPAEQDDSSLQNTSFRPATPT